MNTPRHAPLPLGIVVDTETTGLCPFTHQATEVAWWNLATDEVGHMSLTHTLVDADPVALQVQHYEDRQSSLPHPDLRRLWRTLGGTVADRHEKPSLIGCNVPFDAAMLQGTFHRAGFPAGAPWHYRLIDVSDAARYALGYANHRGQPMRLCELADAFEVEPGDPHTGMGDVLTTGRVFLCLRDLLAERAGVGAVTA